MHNPVTPEWIEVRFRNLETVLGRKIKEIHKGLFTAAIMSDSTKGLMRDKLNEAGYLLEYDGLETLGDSVLGLYVCQISFKQGLNQEGITKNKQKFTANKHIQEVGLKFLKDILINENCSKSDKKTYAKAFERLLGALYEAYGMRFTFEFLKRHINISKL